MKNWIKKGIASVCFVCASICGFAQDTKVEMADAFRSEGKIYVVVGVALILLLGVFVMLFRLEKKVSKLEKE